MGDLWNTIAVNPMFEVLKVFSVGGYLGFGIIFLTIIVRIIIWPLTKRQLRSTKAMQELQPKMAELQKKYGKDKQKLSEETMKLYKEAKINPLGCLLPMIIQLPVWIALFHGIRRILDTPGVVNTNFLWLDLTQSGGYGGFILAIMVGATMFVLQKMSTMPTVDPKQQQMTRIMMFAMPLMFGFITLTLPSGLGLYFLVSNIIGIVMQYFVTGWGTLRVPAWLMRGAKEAGTPSASVTTAQEEKEVKPVTTNVAPVAVKKAGAMKLKGKRRGLGRVRINWHRLRPPLWRKKARKEAPGTPSITSAGGGDGARLATTSMTPVKGKRSGDGKRRSKRKDRRRSHRGGSK